MATRVTLWHFQHPESTLMPLLTVSSSKVSASLTSIFVYWFCLFFFSLGVLYSQQPCTLESPGELLLFIYYFLFLAVLRLRLCARAFSSCGKRGPRFIAVCGPLTIAALLLRSTGSRRAGSVVVAHGPSCSAACGIFPDQGSNPSPLHWQADSQPLRHQGSPCLFLYFIKMKSYRMYPFVSGLLSSSTFWFDSSMFLCVTVDFFF